MIDICIYGRGGQGAQVAGQMVATAFYRSQYRVQNFASYGGAIRGGLVSSNIRADRKPIYLRCNIEKPDLVVFFDDSLVEKRLLEGVTSHGTVLVNTTKKEEHFSAYGLNVYAFDALGSAAAQGLGGIVNTAMVGAMVGVTGWLDPRLVAEVVRELSPAKKEQNVAACMDGHARIGARRGTIDSK